MVIIAGISTEQYVRNKGEHTVCCKIIKYIHITLKIIQNYNSVFLACHMFTHTHTHTHTHLSLIHISEPTRQS